MDVDARLGGTDASAQGIDGRFRGIDLTGVGGRHKAARVRQPTGRVETAHHGADFVLVLEDIARRVLLVGYVLPRIAVVIADVTVDMAV